MAIADISIWAALAVLTLALIGVAIFSSRTHLLHEAAEYAGYGEQYEGTDFEIGRKPSYQELLDGIKRQQNEFLRRMRFMLTGMPDIGAEDQAQWLEEIEWALAKFLEACEGGYKREAHALPLHSVCSRARALSKHPDCPNRLREPLRQWSREVITWRVVTGRLVAYLQDRIKEGSINDRG